MIQLMNEYLRYSLSKLFMNESEHVINENLLILNENDVLPELILENIFLRLSGRDLCENKQLVNKQWHSILSRNKFWLRKCLLDGRVLADQLDKLAADLDFKLVYFVDLFNRNLLDGRPAHWCCTKSLNIPNFNNVDSFRLKQMVDVFRGSRADIAGTWSIVDGGLGYRTRSGEKMQVVDLGSSGQRLIESLLFADSPSGLSVAVSEEYAVQHGSSPSIYKLNVFLVGDQFQLVDNFTFYVLVPSSELMSKWKRCEHSFRVKKPFRYIIYFHAGQLLLLLHNSNSNHSNDGIKMRNGSLRFLV